MAKTEIDKKFNLSQIVAAAIKQSIGERLVIEPRVVAKMSQDARIVMNLDIDGNLVLTVKE